MIGRVRKSAYGDYVAEIGSVNYGGATAPTGTGTTQPGFMMSESARFKDREAANKFLRKKLHIES